MQEFPQLTYVNLQGYDLWYGKTRWGTIARIILQLPKILIKINNENRWLNIFLKKQPVDIIISDNRFGFYSTEVCSVFITHQLYIKTGLGKIADGFVQWLNYRKIARFTTCWVPDFKGASSLAGKLSNPRKMPPVPVAYLGSLSRLDEYITCHYPERIDVLIILSGPEPQRTIFENLLLPYIKHYPGKTVLVQGLPNSAPGVRHEGNTVIYNHAPVNVLNKLICSAEFIISRPGYTSVMDLLKLRKKSIVVPTPGQAEQEYLAWHLAQKRFVYAVAQCDFRFDEVMKAASGFSYQLPVLPMEAYKQVIGDLVQQQLSEANA